MDRATLRALFHSTGGANWLQNDNWDTDAVLSLWHGVKVDDQGRVMKLGLQNNNLQGRLKVGQNSTKLSFSCDGLVLPHQYWSIEVTLSTFNIAGFAQRGPTFWHTPPCSARGLCVSFPM